MKIACYIRNPSVFEELKRTLVGAGHSGTPFDSDSNMLRTLARRPFDFVLIDLPDLPYLPDLLSDRSARHCVTLMSWLAIPCGERPPTMIISPKRDGRFIALALEYGADDVLARPFEPLELLVRMNAVMRRRTPPEHRRTIEYADFILERESTRFSYQGHAISLTPREFDMAWQFFSYPGTYLSHATLGAAIPSVDRQFVGRAIEQHIDKLRKKLTIGGRRIAAIRGAYHQGYRLEVL